MSPRYFPPSRDREGRLYEVCQRCPILKKIKLCMPRKAYSQVMTFSTNWGTPDSFLLFSQGVKKSLESSIFTLSSWKNPLVFFGPRRLRRLRKGFWWDPFFFFVCLSCVCVSLSSLSNGLEGRLCGGVGGIEPATRRRLFSLLLCLEWTDGVKKELLLLDVVTEFHALMASGFFSLVYKAISSIGRIKAHFDFYCTFL